MIKNQSEQPSIFACSTLSLRRKLALKHHPDKNPDNKEKAEKKVLSTTSALASLKSYPDSSSLDYSIPVSTLRWHVQLTATFSLCESLPGCQVHVDT
jgi:hypothetical protein